MYAKLTTYDRDDNELDVLEGEVSQTIVHDWITDVFNQDEIAMTTTRAHHGSALATVARITIDFVRKDPT